MEKMLQAFLAFRMWEPHGGRRGGRKEVLKTDCCWYVPTQGHSVRKENSVILTELDFVSPSELAHFKHLYFHGNQQERQLAGHEASASSVWKGTRWFVMKHILVRK